MDIMELGAIGELVGGVAVLVTLVYLALQVRSGAREQKVSSVREATRELGAVVQAIGETEEKAGIWLKGIREFESMAEPEQVRFSAVASHLLRLYEQLYYQNRERSIDPEIWKGFSGMFHDFLAYPGFQAWWATRSHWYGENFRTVVDSHMSPDNPPKFYTAPRPGGAGS